MQRCILHRNIYAQFYVKTGTYAADEDPYNVREDTAAGDVLLCAMLLKTSGPDEFVSWFRKHFSGLFAAAEQAHTT